MALVSPLARFRAHLVLPPATRPPAPGTARPSAPATVRPPSGAQPLGSVQSPSMPLSTLKRLRVAPREDKTPTHPDPHVAFHAATEPLLTYPLDLSDSTVVAPSWLDFHKMINLDVSKAFTTPLLEPTQIKPAPQAPAEPVKSEIAPTPDPLVIPETEVKPETVRAVSEFVAVVASISPAKVATLSSPGASSSGLTAISDPGVVPIMPISPPGLAAISHPALAAISPPDVAPISHAESAPSGDLTSMPSLASDSKTEATTEPVAEVKHAFCARRRVPRVTEIDKLRDTWARKKRKSCGEGDEGSVKEGTGNKKSKSSCVAGFSLPEKEHKSTPVQVCYLPGTGLHPVQSRLFHVSCPCTVENLRSLPLTNDRPTKKKSTEKTRPSISRKSTKAAERKEVRDPDQVRRIELGKRRREKLKQAVALRLGVSPVGLVRLLPGDGSATRRGLPTAVARDVGALFHIMTSNISKTLASFTPQEKQLHRSPSVRCQTKGQTANVLTALGVARFINSRPPAVQKRFARVMTWCRDVLIPSLSAPLPDL